MSKVPEQPKGPRPGKAGPPASGAGGRKAGPAATSASPSAKSAPAAPPGRARPALTSRAAILALVMCAIALSLAYPVREYILQRSEIAKLQEERERTEQNVDELQQRHDELRDPSHIEREARTRLHYQYPGERAYVVISEDEQQTEQGESSEADGPWFTRLWKSVQEADEPVTEDEEIPEAQPPDR
ncbi:FtsB family cell division protein [Allosalinactinospora lopnorensis]|uniref:FtsB family cell division protein n=1 Tax=Allosalinactinospora lopnorensis TaxID=1352348 RepID=UPI000B338241|nr:septum formation initiator family protein [Allosalinactinospora lopnorensis]